jgi:hypothetical protein
MRRGSWSYVVIALVAVLLAVAASHMSGARSFAQWIHGHR